MAIMDGRETGWERLQEIEHDGWYIRRGGDKTLSAGLPGHNLNILADGSHTRGLVTFFEYTIDAGAAGPPPHWHQGHDEMFYVVSGQMTVAADGKEDLLKPRDFLFVPRGVVHNFDNPFGEQCVFVCAWNPPGAEQVWPRLRELTPEDWQNPDTMAELIALSESQPAPE